MAKGVGVGVTVGEVGTFAAVEGVGVGVGVGEGSGAGDATVFSVLMRTPLFQANFPLDFLQV